ncbi:WBP11, partial [Cordylochernes scorpioides]
MGRRSINTTKSGKYMNPTDQARKEARKRELKKNKIQRQLVRTAVLKGKDPVQILADLRNIDEMQYNTETPPPLNERVLKEKRKKLQDTWNRVLSFYHKEEHEKWRELKRLESDYTKNRDLVIKFYESVKSAQNVQLDDIPLPTAPSGPGMPHQIPLPPDTGFGLSPHMIQHPVTPASILKKLPIVGYNQKDDTIKKPPGVPPGPPPELSDDEDIENLCGNRQEEKEHQECKKRKIRFADEDENNMQVPPNPLREKRMRMAGQDVTEFFKEIDAVQKNTVEGETNISANQSDVEMREAPPLMFHPPPPRPGMMPPRPMPPSMPPPHMAAMLGPRSLPLIRPGAPPLGIPPRIIRPPPGLANVVRAPPSFSKSKLEEKRSTTIEAKPQLRALRAELILIYRSDCQNNIKMGRRSINTTKSGKYMNPTDQARKEARKRELKKNKKQRQLVRTAVLKGKDPVQILADLQKIDEMQYNTETPPPLNEKVLKDKRKKLQDTWNRVLRLYHKEDHEKWRELKRLELDYTKNRDQVIKFYESVKSAQNVQLDDIPLPTAPSGPGMPHQIPLPPDTGFGLSPHMIQHPVTPASILKKLPIVGYNQKDDTIKKPPGVPPGPPPELSDDEDIENLSGNRRDEKEDQKGKKRKIRFADEDEKNKQVPPNPLQAKIMTMAGQDITEFFKEIDAVQKNTVEGETDISVGQSDVEMMDEMREAPPPPLMFHPPPPRPGMMPPRPMPPSMPPPRMAAMLGPRPPPLIRPGAPPLGIPPRIIRPPPGLANVVSAPPSLSKSKLEEKRSATIEAKPQLRALNAEVTRFLPTTLRVKREDHR